MRVTALLLSVALVLFSFGTALGQDQGVYLHSVDGLNGGGGIDPGTSVTFKFGFKNDEAVPIVVVSHGIHVYTADGITWTSFEANANPAYNWDLNFGFPCFFDLGFFCQQYFSDDGMLDDTLGIGGAKGQFGTGLPSGFNDWAVGLSIGPVDGNGVLHIDSCFYPPAGYWMWGLSGGDQAACAWPGPFDFAVGGTPGEPPVIAEIADFTVTEGDAVYYDVEATGDPAPTFDFVTAPSFLAIDAVTGEITGTAGAAGTYPVTVIATNSEGDDTEDFTLTVEEIPQVDPVTYLEQDPIMLKDLADRVLRAYVENEDVGNIDLSTVRLQGKIPPYTAARIEGDLLVTDAFIFRFLSAYRPISASVQSTYTVSYTVGGVFKELTGPCNIYVPAGDVTLDGYVDEKDAEFMRDYLWKGGAVSELEEMMDVNVDGRVDVSDLSAIIEAIQ